MVRETGGSNGMPGMSQRLQEAYAAFMAKAPGAAFQRARALYINKYPLPQNDDDLVLKLYIWDEQLDERVEPANDGDPAHRLVTLRSQPGALAIVHWQQPEPPTRDHIREYLASTWDLNAETLDLEPSSEPWFRNGGHQTRFRPPQPPTWQQQSLLTLRE